MKRIFLVIGAIATLLLAGCNQSNQGGTSDQYNGSNARGSSSNANHSGTSSNANP